MSESKANPAQTEPLNIYQRLNAVRSKIGYLQKDAEVQGYKAITHDLVTAAVRPHLIEYGVLIIPNQVGGESINIGQTKSGAPIIRYEAEYNVAFVNIDNPEDLVVVRVQSHANDHGDKAPGKACSYAVKYAILKVFSIETGETEESRIDIEGLKPITEEQAAEIENLVAEAEADKAKYLEYLRQAGKVRITSIEDIPAKMFEDAKAALVSKIEDKRKRDAAKEAK